MGLISEERFVAKVDYQQDNTYTGLVPWLMLMLHGVLDNVLLVQ